MIITTTAEQKEYFPPFQDMHSRPVSPLMNGVCVNIYTYNKKDLLQGRYIQIGTTDGNVTEEEKKISTACRRAAATTTTKLINVLFQIYEIFVPVI